MGFWELDCSNEAVGSSFFPLFNHCYSSFRLLGSIRIRLFDSSWKREGWDLPLRAVKRINRDHISCFYFRISNFFLIQVLARPKPCS